VPKFREYAPYAIVSVLVLGPSGSGQRSRVGETPPYSRWQFFSPTAGDLNADGFVDGVDRDVLLGFRGVTSLIPGDLNKDGKVDLRDARAILGLLGTGSSRSSLQSDPIQPRDQTDADLSNRVDIPP